MYILDFVYSKYLFFDLLHFEIRWHNSWFVVSTAAAVCRSSRAWRFRSSFGGSREVQMDSAKNLFTLVPLILQGKPEEKTALLLGNKDIELTENTFSPKIFGIPNEVRHYIATQHVFLASLYSRGCVKHLRSHKSSVTQRAFAHGHLPIDKGWTKGFIVWAVCPIGMKPCSFKLLWRTESGGPGWRVAAHDWPKWPKISRAQWSGCL